MTLTVLIADDHPLVRDALARTVRELADDVRTHQAGGLDAMLHLAATVDADLALVDLNMPGMDGVAGLARLRQAPTLAVVVASGQEDAATIRAVLVAGAVGFIPKSERPEVLLSALGLVLAGGSYVPARLLEAAPPPAAVAAASDLTPRQLDVLRCLMRGEPNKLIARELGIDSA